MINKSNTFVYELDGRLYINLTNRCSNDCVFCLRNSGNGVKDSTLWLEFEPTADEVITQIKQVNFEYDEAVFCGYGESTYRLNELCTIAAYLKEHNKMVRLNTNGLGNLINKTDIVPILKEYIDSVSVSLNASCCEEYLNLCKPTFGLASYFSIIEFAKSCINNDIDTAISIVDIISDESIEKCRQISLEIGAKFKIREHITDNKSYK